MSRVPKYKLFRPIWMRSARHGPVLPTGDEEPDPQSLPMWCDVNGNRKQDGDPRDMIFPTSNLIWYISQFIRLEPGDLICTGTPSGVGLGANPPCYLGEGDAVEVGIADWGVIRQRATRVQLPALPSRQH